MLDMDDNLLILLEDRKKMALMTIAENREWQCKLSVWHRFCNPGFSKH